MGRLEATHLSRCSADCRAQEIPVEYRMQVPNEETNREYATFMDKAIAVVSGNFSSSRARLDCNA